MNHEKQVILLMIPKAEERYYIVVTKLTAWLRGITSNHQSDVYCLICLHSF